MARKYDLISELYNRTCKTVVSNPQNWQAFLASACRNYKLRYGIEFSADGSTEVQEVLLFLLMKTVQGKD